MLTQKGPRTVLRTRTARRSVSVPLINSLYQPPSPPDYSAETPLAGPGKERNAHQPSSYKPLSPLSLGQSPLASAARAARARTAGGPAASCARPRGRASRPSGLEAFSRCAAPVALPRAARHRGRQRGAGAVPLVLRARAPATKQ